ncbi:hypothetical protein AB0F77_22830 [Streptomyces sp. NPDC026672]|uniref:hypothetical protein n=1 Tax=unclassified Streptomyces TaxID=2593676 RepID=UPI003409475E
MEQGAVGSSRRLVPHPASDKGVVFPISEEKVGQVSRRRYDEIVSGDRQLVTQIGRAMFTIGDHALEIEPVRPVGGSAPASDALFGVNASLQIYAADIGLSLKTVLHYQFTSHRWPAGRRRDGVSPQGPRRAGRHPRR